MGQARCRMPALLVRLLLIRSKIYVDSMYTYTEIHVMWRNSIPLQLYWLAYAMYAYVVQPSFLQYIFHSPIPTPWASAPPLMECAAS